MSTFYKIPLRNDSGFYSFNMELDGDVFTFNIRYNARMGKWLMDLIDSDGSYVVAGQVLVIGDDLLIESARENKPLGTLTMLNIKEPNVDADRYALGRDAFLYYEALE